MTTMKYSFVQQANMTQKNHFIVDSKYDADLIIYYADRLYNAGWRNNGKNNRYTKKRAELSALFNCFKRFFNGQKTQ